MDEQLTMAPLPCLRICWSSNFRQLQNAAKIDAHDFVVVFARSVGGVGENVLHTGVVEGCIEAAEGSNGLVNHSFDLGFVGDVADDGENFVTFGAESRGCRFDGLLIAVGKRYRGAGFGESFRRSEAESRGGAGYECDFIFEEIFI